MSSDQREWPLDTVTSRFPGDTSRMRIGWAREHMANFKVPRRVEVLDALPLNASGKVLRYELRDRAVAAAGEGNGS